MWRSCLLINVGDNPDRPRPGRLWLRNLYHVHQRLCMAFPSQARKDADPHFLAPYAPDDFPEQRHLACRSPEQVGRHILNHVHAQRGDGAGFLYRIDPESHCGLHDARSDLSAPRVVILVQSAAEPDWDYAFRHAEYFLAAPPEKKEFDPAYNAGDRLRFRIRVNLSKKIKKSRSGKDLTKPTPGTYGPGIPKAQSKRVALTWDSDKNRDDVIREWFADKGRIRTTKEGKREGHGFEVDEKAFRVQQVGWGAGIRPGRPDDHDERDECGDRRLKFRSALLEGTLTVTDAELFRNAVIRGVGSAKAFGFGLLSVAPIPGTPYAP